MALEIMDICIQLYRFPQVQLIADLSQGLEYHLGPGKGIIGNAGYSIVDQTVFLKDFTPHAEHSESLL